MNFIKIHKAGPYSKTVRDLCKIPLFTFSPTAETQTQIFGCFRAKYPRFSLRIPHNRAFGPPFRHKQAYLACWRLSTGSNTSPSDGFAHSLCSDQNKLPGRSGIYGDLYKIPPKSPKCLGGNLGDFVKVSGRLKIRL